MQPALRKKLKPLLNHLPKLATGMVILLTLLTFFEISPMSVSGHTRHEWPLPQSGGCDYQWVCPADYTTCQGSTPDAGYMLWFCPQNQASCNSTSNSGFGGPTSTNAGKVENFTFNMTNTGHDAWNPNAIQVDSTVRTYPYVLRYYIVDSNGTWQVSGRTPSSGLTSSVAAGSLYGFNENITMPQTTGVHTLKWHMERMGADGPGQQAFGQQCEKTIVVGAALPTPIPTPITIPTCDSSDTKQCGSTCTLSPAGDTCGTGTKSCRYEATFGGRTCTPSTYFDESCTTACSSGRTCYNDSICVASPTNVNLTVNGTSNPNTLYADRKAGILSGSQGVGWLNPAIITVVGTLQSPATSFSKYYAAIYNTDSSNFSTFIDNSDGNPISGLKTLLTTDKKAGLVLRYENSVSYVWNPWSGNWQAIPAAGTFICSDSSCSSSSRNYYRVERNAAGSWKVSFYNDFGSKRLYTAAKVVDNNNQETTNPNTTP